MDGQYIRKVLAAIGLAILGIVVLMLFKKAGHVLILFFAGCLVSVSLIEVSGFLAAKTPVPRKLWVGVGLLVIAALLVGAGFIFGPRVAEQADKLAENMPKAVDSVKEFVSRSPLLEELADRIPPPGKIAGSVRDMLMRTAGILSSLAGALLSAGIVLFIGIYMAVSPKPYVKGALKLLPPGRREQGRKVLRRTGSLLGRWVIGRLASMTVVGILTWIALLILGIPLAFLLSLIAAILSFVPFFGPIVSAVPAVLIGFTIGPQTALWVIVAYLVVQVLESNMLTPIIQHKAVYIPPAMIVLSQMIFGAFFGLLGVVFATPLAALVLVLIEQLYNRGIWDEEETLPVSDKPLEDAGERI